MLRARCMCSSTGGQRCLQLLSCVLDIGSM
ncbi:hypothetical protein EYF80_044571 [Liparis tanakae]|uniref:Uncharacterized protein n=1 Tax=Liparis tanakae TaxID=230148 RepID=A0A4Z2FVF2_9TELE|nr:hypothetical protein EYF80_044571 [Liparis tanakae]